MVLIKFYKDSFYEGLKQVLEECDLYDPVWDDRKNLKRKIERDPQSILIAEDAGRVIGCVFIVEDGWNGFIWRLGVRQEYRKKVVGLALMQKAEEIIRKRGINESSLFIDPKNENLQEWYKNQGYRKTTNWTFMYKKLN